MEDLVINRSDRLSICTAYADDQLPLNPETFFKNAEESQSEVMRYPLCTTHLDITTDCNFNCPTCIESQYRQTRAYLSFQTICRVLEDVHHLGCRDLRLYGGEPTLHSNLPEVISHALGMGFSIRLVTNGSMLDNDNLVQSITSSNRVCVRVSLNAHTPQTHSMQHGCPDTQFHKIQKQVTTLMNLHGRVGISYLLTPRSIQELDNACHFWKENGAETLSIRMMTAPHGLQSKFELSEDARREILRVLNKYHDWISLASGSENWLIDGKHLQQERYKYCYSGYFRLILSPFTPPSPTSYRSVRKSDSTVSETDRMWISACPYQRNEESSGCIYPESLSDWWINKRREWLDNLWTKVQTCPDTICSRNNLNKRIHDALRKQSRSNAELDCPH